METNNTLQVWYKDKCVGTLALTGDKKAAFEYSDEWIQNGFSISPFSLPLEKKVFVPTKAYFGGLFGVFADSLPDAWGNILLNRILKQHGMNPNELTVLDRLAIVGDSGMGALTYRPAIRMTGSRTDSNLDQLAVQCQKILTTAYSENLDELYRLGGTCGGARPKIMTRINEEEWIIKFPEHTDGMNSGQMEYEYSQCAKDCGISMTETRIFPSECCIGYFGTKRFDRMKNKSGQEEKIHMCTADALLEVDFNQPSLDYRELMKLVKILTRDNPMDVENMFFRMCFNVFADNRDDHAKNFSYIYNEELGTWRLSPAYDITYSTTYYGEHTTSVNGNGRNPSAEDLLKIGIQAGMSRKRCHETINEIEHRVRKQLGKYL